MAEELIGKVTHYFGKPKVAAIEVTDGQLNVGDTIHIIGPHDDYTHRVESMQIEHAPVQTAKSGDKIGIVFPEHVHECDKVYRVAPE
jgi:translation initiation factor IF-2